MNWIHLLCFAFLLHLLKKTAFEHLNEMILCFFACDRMIDMDDLFLKVRSKSFPLINLVYFMKLLNE